MWMGHMFGWGGTLLGGLITVLLLAGLIALVVLAVRASAGTRRQVSYDKPETALDIVNRRYVRGEITKAEYEEIRVSLQSDNSGG